MPPTRVTLTLPPEGHWLPLVEQALASYSRAAGFSAPLRDMLSSAVLETFEELMRASAEAGSASPCTLTLDSRGEAVIAEVEYSSRIPLNPLPLENYEVPDSEADLEALNTSALWLHLVKRRMDRVYFLIRGSRSVLRMVKYRRDEGRERSAWIMAVRPSLAKGLHLHLSGAESGHPSSVLQKSGGSVLKLGPGETFLVRRMDGTATFHDLYMAHVEEIGLISPATLVSLYESLETHEMLAPPEGEPRPSRMRSALERFLKLDVSIPRPDALVTRAHRLSRFMFSRWGLYLLLGIGLSGIIPFVQDYERFVDAVVDLEEVIMQDPAIILPVYVLLLLHIALHELGHGVVCKHYGGSIPRMGMMFYLGSFMFYCDTTAAWNFQERKQRIMVSLGGPLVSFAVLGAGLWGAALAVNDSTVETVLVAFNIISFFGLAMNFNPFIKMDAYYILVDATDIPNLRVRSFRYLERRLLGWLGFGEEQSLRATPWERRLYWAYGLTGTAVTVFFLALPMLHLADLLRDESASRGKLILTMLLCAYILGRLGTVAFRKIRQVRRREHRLS